nr:amidohydrolase [uncultured Dysosmobacter sp.]
MLFSNIDILDEQLEHRRGCYVGVRGQRIAYIGREKPREDFGEVYDGAGRLLMTGFINTHSHSAMTLMRGYAENLALSDWLNRRIFPFEAKLDEEAIYNGVMLAAAEMLRFGIVSTTDMYFNIAAASRAVLDSGVKMNFGLGLTCFDGRGARELPMGRELLEALPRYQDGGDGRFRLDAAIHAEYTSTPRVVEDMAAIAKEHGLNLQVHLSETRDEQEACKRRHGGRTPARYFYDAGVFDVPVTAAHCVWLEGDDFDILREKDVTAACCPVSNLKLASGFCPAPRLLEAGVRVGLGTDSVASNNSLNMLEEIKLFATLFKASTGDPTAITPKQALYAATRAGALAQGRQDCGVLKVGSRADLIVLDLRQRPYLRPCHDMVNNVVFSAQGTDVCLTMVDGRVLYRDGAYTTLDPEAVARNAEQSVEKILRQL